ncbi:MAG: hypothetical protein V4724_14605 [Pseudomonadota bacterium]
MDLFSRSIVLTAACWPYAAYALYFPLAFICNSDDPGKCWLLYLPVLSYSMLPFLSLAAAGILTVECTRPPPQRLPYGPLSVFLVSQMLGWAICLVHGKFLQALPLALRNGHLKQAMQLHGAPGDVELTYLVFVVVLPLLAAFIGLGWFLLMSRRPYAEKGMTFILFICSMAGVAVLHLSGLLPLPDYLAELFWMVPVGVCLVYLHTGRRARTAL